MCIFCLLLYRLATLNTRVSLLADAYDSRDLSEVTSPINIKKYEVAMKTTENTGEIPKLFLSILLEVNPKNYD